ncbi:MAG: hypothetical protein L6R41_007631 [Letrouitia leprolyta]|nr:MAG: hypothetical protein L6R41_007631 [Letrouitia leprolyta]
MLQLHVWGPAFGLPSLDPQCLAAIAYLSKAVPQAEWELIASSDPLLSPTSSYSSFLETQGQPLLDLSLYVSSENYHASTRPAYSRILQWPNTWLLPPKRRAAAKSRTAYLGFSTLDLDVSGENDKIQSQFAAGTEIPKIIASTQQTVSALVSQPQHATRFRLDTLADSFLGPLSRLQQGKKYLILEGQMTSLDCLALGYLSLALLPEVPQSWLSQAMKSRYPSLCRYVKDLAGDCFGIRPPLEAESSSVENTGRNLPWKDPSTETASTLIRLRSSLESLPYIGALYQPASLQQSTTTTHKELIRLPVVPTIFTVFAASVTGLASYYLLTGELPPTFGFPWLFNLRQRPHRLSDMGDAGVMLGAVRFRNSP